jgi:hypothetical protein
VKIGSSAFGTTCERIVAARDTPFARAVRTKSSPATSSTDARISRA